MKADKLFLLINEIDDRLIDDAERTDDSPIEIEYEPKRFRIKEPIALAACAAVLVFGVITVVKLRIGGIDTPFDSGANSEYSESIDDTSNSSETSETSETSKISETGEVILTVDREFPEITQIKLPAGSFDDKLRHIILSARTVEELENRIAEIDDGRVSDVSVAKKTDKIEYLKTGEPVTEGNIEEEMFVRVALEDGVRYTYYVGYVFDSSQKCVGEPFILDLYGFAHESVTFDEFIETFAKYDDYKRVDEIHLYRNKYDYNNDIEVAGGDTVLENGMYFYIIYDDGEREATFEVYK